MRSSGSSGMFNIEYVTVLIIFIAFSAYFTFRLTEQRPAYVLEVRKEIFRSDNYVLSEVLVNDAGEPSDWDALVGKPGEAGIARLGLFDQSANLTNRLSLSKVSALDAMCKSDGYGKIKSLLGERHNFSILISDSQTGSILANCTNVTTPEALASIKRVVAFDGGGWGYVYIQSWN